MPTANSKVKIKELKVEKPKVKLSGLSAPVYSLLGAKSSTSISLPKEIFGVEVNQDLLSQAMRVYLNNQKAHNAHTKTRAEVSMTGAKWFRQKGTGRARHGAKSAPIFVGGGVALGPKNRRIRLELPAKMRQAALKSALSLRVKEGELLGLSGLDKSTGKTKEMANLVDKLTKSSVLLIGEGEQAKRAVRNLPKMEMKSPEILSVLDVVKYKTVLLTKEAVEKLESRIKGGKNA